MSRPAPAQLPPGRDRVRRAAASGAFVCIAGIFAARGILGETFQRVELSYLSSQVADIGPTPGITALLDALLLAAAGLLLLCEPRVRPAPAFLRGAGLLLLAAAVSTAAAHDKRVALNAVSHLVATLAAGGAAALAARSPGRASLLLAALVASTSTNALKCITQQSYEFQESLQYWQQQKQDLAARGVDLSAPEIVNYERRLRSGESFGHLAHGNVTADCMSAGLILAVAACVAAGASAAPRRRRMPVAVVAAVGAFVLAWGIRTTDSTAAYVGVGVGLVCLAFLLPSWPKLAARPGPALLLLTIPYLLLIAGGLAYALLRDTLPGASLAFRWEYWKAAAQAFFENPLTGLGRENFLAAFLRFKPAWITEEVRDPHNIWLTLLVELGPLGLLGGGTLILFALLRLFRASAAAPAGGRAVVAVAKPGGGLSLYPVHLRPFASRVGVIVVVALVHALASREPGDPATTLLWIVQPMLVWSIAFVAGVTVIETLDALGAAPSWRAAAILAAAATLLVEGLVSFTLITTAGLSLFVGLLAAVHGPPADEGASAAAAPQPRGRERRPPGPARPAAAWGPWLGAGAVALAVAQLALVTAPALAVERRLAALRPQLRRAADPTAIMQARRTTEALQAADPWDAEALRSAAEQWLRAAFAPLLNDATRLTLCASALRAAEAARSRNPYSISVVRVLSQVYEAQAAILAHRGDAGGEAEANERAVATLTAACGLYPTDPALRLRLGLVLYDKWKRTGMRDAGERALGSFAAAERIDATRAADNASKLPAAAWAEVRPAQTALQAAGLAPSDSPPG